MVRRVLEVLEWIMDEITGVHPETVMPDVIEACLSCGRRVSDARATSAGPASAARAGTVGWVLECDLPRLHAPRSGAST